MGNPATLIVGGGISGLSTAWFLHQKGHAVTVLESRDQAGGNLASSRVGGYLVEHGPNSTLQRPGDQEGLTRLVAELELGERLRVANSLANNRFVIKDGQLVSLPASPGQFFKTPLFSLSAKLKLLMEPFIRSGHGEETIADFVTRRLGPEFLEYAVGPFVSGVYAGDPQRLSVRAAVPRVHALEQEYGSLIVGALNKMMDRKPSTGPAGRLVSFDEGMEVLPRAIAAALPPGSVRTDCRVTGLERSRDRWVVAVSTLEGEEAVLEASRLILSVPAPVAADLLEPLSPRAAELLRKIPYAPVCSLALGFLGMQVDHPMDGFGFLAPKSAGIRVLGALFSSTLFPGRAPEGRQLLTAFLGGVLDPSVLELNDQEMVEQAANDIRPLLHVAGAPDFVFVTRYRRAIPQYEIGHLGLIEGLDEELVRFPELYTRANWRDGISVGDCVENGRRLAERIG